MKFTEKKIDAIGEAYRQNLAVEFYYESDYLKYRIEPSMFSILRKENCTYTKIVSYNISQLLKGDMNGKTVLTLVCNSGGLDAGEIYFMFTVKTK